MEHANNSNLNLKLISYNCRGFNSYKSTYVASLLSDCSFLLLQEHWLSDAQMSLLGNIDKNILYYGVSGFGSQSVLSGRPYGGCAILWHSDMRVDIHPVCIDSRRICAVSVSSESWKIIIVNVYMPCDNSDANSDEFMYQLSLIEDVYGQSW